MTTEDLEARRKYNRERKARQRAAKTPEQRAEARRVHDANYREIHREQRREYDRQRLVRKAVSRPSREATNLNIEGDAK